ncbi:hypothetical protein HDU76_008893, partial [Blyttiomyces sp. JEL0837]
MASSSIPKITSHWERLPPELKRMVLNNCDLLTQFLNNNLTDDQIEKLAVEIWNVAIKTNYAGDLSKLPSSGFPTIANGLGKVSSKKFYRRLCKLRPDLAGTDKLQNFFDEANWDWAGCGECDCDSDCADHEYDPHHDDSEDFEEWSKSLTEMDDLLIHIPLRRGWSDEISSIKLDCTFYEVKLFIFAGFRGHGKLFNKLWPIARKQFNFYVFETVLDFMLVMGSQWGYLDIIRTLIKRGYANRLENFGEALDVASERGHLDLVTELVTVNGTDRESALIAASNTGQLHVIRYLMGERNVDPGCWDNEAIVSACENGQLDVVKFLLEQVGVDASAQNNKALRMA